MPWSHLGLACFLLVGLIPILISLVYALLYSLGLVGLLAEGFTLDHWGRVLGRGEIWASLGVSAAVAGATVAATVGLALMLALTLRRHLGKEPLSTIIFLPLALPAVVTAFFVFRVFSDAGLLARMAMGLGLIEAPNQFPAMVHDPLAMGVILAHLLFAVPYFTLLFGQIYKDAHVARLENLAQTLGGNRLQCLARVTLPILIDKAGTQLLLLFITVFGSYEIPLLLGRQSPQMISVLTLRKYQMFDILQKPEAFIAALLYTLFVTGLLWLAFRRGRMFRDV